MSLIFSKDQGFQNHSAFELIQQTCAVSDSTLLPMVSEFKV